MQKIFRILLPGLAVLYMPLAAAQDKGPLPDGPGVNLVYAKCQQCHPINYVAESAGLPDFLWEDTLSLMKQLGMQVTAEEEERILEYLTTYMGTEPPPEPAADSGEPVGTDAAAVYAESCAVCHGAEGQGTSGAFPPLAGHASKLAAADRSYMPLLVLYGLSGPIDVAGTEFNGVMPAWDQLGDEEIAAVLNLVARGWDVQGQAEPAVAPYTAEDIESARGLGLSAGQVHERRPAITAGE
ncbi:MAG TPA: c-type cytochrome [Arenicellales bacterium]|nr:c-type cytochrome [Arenicellales bacterium]